MKTIFAILFCAVLMGACASTEGIVLYPEEITRCKIVLDTVLYAGNNPTERHEWDYEVTGEIHNEQFLADDYEYVRTCKFCERTELVHSVTWSEKVKK
jgi:hypothetical protein